MDQAAVDHITAFLEIVSSYEDTKWTSEEYLILQEWALEADTYREEMSEEDGLALDGLMLASGLMKPEFYQGPGAMQEAADRKPVTNIWTGDIDFVPEGDCHG